MMKTVKNLKFLLLLGGIMGLNIAKAQPGDPGDPCPSWPFCDSVTTIETVDLNRAEIITPIAKPVEMLSKNVNASKATPFDNKLVALYKKSVLINPEEN